MLGGSKSETTTPNLPDWYSAFLGGLPQQYNALYSKLTQPVIGQQQVLDYLSGLNKQYGNQQSTVMQQLARSGALNSGRAATVQTGLSLDKLRNASSYLANVPFENAKFLGQYAPQVLGLGMNFKVPYGTTTKQKSGLMGKL